MLKQLTILIATSLPVAAHAAPAYQQIQRPNGTPILYSLDLPTGPSAGLVVLLTGSGCLPGTANKTLALVRAAFPGHTALIVEKVGVTPDAGISDGFTDCPPAFHAGHTVSQRVDDTAVVLDHLGTDAPLVLFGGSEGGLTAAILSQRVAADAVILLSSGPGMAFDELVLATVPPEGQATVRAGFDAARADPQGNAMFAGSSHRFWADILPYRALDYMAGTETPYLLIQGGLDKSSPIEAARLTADRFAADGRCNLTYWELPALDHGMKDPAGTSHMTEVLAFAATWTQAAKPTC